MDIREIKEILEAEGGKLIIVEDGKPTMVIMGFRNYKKNLQQPIAEPGTVKAKDIAEESADDDFTNNPVPVDDEDMSPEPLRIEDLPF